MAQVWATVIVALILAGIFGLMRSRPRSAVIGVAIGAVCGLAGGFFIVRQQVDVIPDTVEAAIVALLVVLGSLGLIIITWLRWTRG